MRNVYIMSHDEHEISGRLHVALHSASAARHARERPVNFGASKIEHLKSKKNLKSKVKNQKFKATFKKKKKSKIENRNSKIKNRKSKIIVVFGVPYLLPYACIYYVILKASLAYNRLIMYCLAIHSFTCSN